MSLKEGGLFLFLTVLLPKCSLFERVKSAVVVRETGKRARYRNLLIFRIQQAHLSEVSMKHLALFLCLLWLVPVCGLCETILWEDEAGQVAASLSEPSMRPVERRASL